MQNRLSRRQSGKLLAAAIASVGLAGLRSSDADGSMTIDVRADAINGVAVVDRKNISINVGDTLTLNVVARITGTNAVQLTGNFDSNAVTDTRNDDAFQALVGGFQSSGGVKGDFLGGANANFGGGNQVYPFTAAGSQNGTARDFDSDGDLDLGAIGTDPTPMWAARSNDQRAVTVSKSNSGSQTRFGTSDLQHTGSLAAFVEDAGGPNAGIADTRIIDATTSEILIGELSWVCTGGTGQLALNFVPRANNDQSTALWFEDGSATAKTPANSIFSVGQPVVTLPASSGQLLWQPTGGSHAWDTASTNWLDTGSPSTFSNGRSVLFTATGAGVVNVAAGGVSPSQIDIKNVSGVYTFSSGPILGSCNVNVDGGSAVFDHTNSFSGNITISNGGVLAINGEDACLGNAANVVTLKDGGTIRLQDAQILSSTRAFVFASGTGTIDAQWNWATSGSVTGTGTLVKNGPGTFGFSNHANNEFNGDKIVNAGLLSIGGAFLMGGTLTDNAAVQFSNGGALTYSGNIGGTGLINVTGPGLLTLTGNSSLTGTILVFHSQMQIGDGGTSGSVGGNISLNSGSLTFNRSDDSSYTGSISGTGQVTKLGSGTLTLLSATSSSTVSTSVAAGELRIGNGGTSGTISGPISTAAGTTVSFNRSNNLTYTNSISGSGSLRKLGGGMLSLTSNNTFTGGTVIQSGTLSIGNGGTTGTMVGDIVNQSSLVVNLGSSITLSGLISGSGSLTKMGSGGLTLTGNNTYTGGTTNSGFLVIGDSVSSGAIVGDVVNTGTMDLHVGSGVYNLGTIQGISSSNGGVLVCDADLVVDRMFDQRAGFYANATLRPNGTNSGVSRFTDLTVGGFGKFDITNNRFIDRAKDDLGHWSNTGYTGLLGLIQRGRNGGPGGGVTAPFWDGTYSIVTSQTQATTSNLTSIGIAKASEIRPLTATTTALWSGQTIDGNDLLVMYTYGGDANLDGKINVDDYVRIDAGISLFNDGYLPSWTNGDFNYDGKINVDDYTIIDANLANQGGLIVAPAGGIGDVTAVPEPAVGSLLGLVAIGAVLPRRRAQTRRLR